MDLSSGESLMMQLKRFIDLVVISDTHLGTYDCHAKEFFEYLDTIHPKILILNGDIIDFGSAIHVMLTDRFLCYC